MGSIIVVASLLKVKLTTSTSDSSSLLLWSSLTEEKVVKKIRLAPSMDVIESRVSGKIEFVVITRKLLIIV